MPNQAEGARVICPYYRYEQRDKITCEGFWRWQTIDMRFRTRKKKDEWRERCCEQYEYKRRCPLAMAITANEEKKLAAERKRKTEKEQANA